MRSLSTVLKPPRTRKTQLPQLLHDIETDRLPRIYFREHFFPTRCPAMGVHATVTFSQDLTELMTGILSAGDNSSEESGDYSTSLANNCQAVSKFGYCCPSLLTT
jgi:hypothetical protein